MQKLTTIAMLIALVGGVSWGTSYEVGPEDLVEEANFATSMFGYDWDAGKPIGVPVAGPTGFGNSSFWSDVQGSAAGGGRDYTALRLNPAAIFSGGVTVGDLDRFAFWTKKGDVNSIDWQLKIYTAKASIGDPGWYGHRFNFVRPDASDTNWNLSDTDTNMNVEWIRSGGGVSEYPTNMSLVDLHAAYGAEYITFIDVIAGYATSSPPVDSYLDGVVLELGNGSTTTLNLIPEPATMSLLALGGLALIRRRRQA